MDLNHFQEGDIYRWSWNDKALKQMNNSSTHYWCCSRIGVVKNGVLIDTYWHDNSEHNKKFNREQCEENLILEFVANFSDLVSANPSDRAYYLDDDCIDLNHANSSRGNFYIKKGASKNIEKIKRILNRKKNELKRQLKRIEWDIEIVDKEIAGANIDTYLATPAWLNINDTSYQDEESQ